MNMELEPDYQEEVTHQKQHSFKVGVADLVSRPIALWYRKILSYIVLVGIVRATIFAVEAIFYWYYHPSIDAWYFITPISQILEDMGYLSSFTLMMDLIVIISGLDIFILISAILILAEIIMYAIFGGAVVKMALDDYGNPGAGDAGRSFSHAMSKKVNLILSQFIFAGLSLVIISPILVILTWFQISTESIFNPTSFPLFFSFIPLMLFCGIILSYAAIRISPLTAVVVAEDKSPVEAIKRAYKLTEGQFWRVLGGQALLMLLLGGLSSVIWLIALPPLLSQGVWLFIVPMVIAVLILSPLGFIQQAVLYKDLKERVPGIPQGQEWW
jgi:hypothetical protein